jgi:prepilin-type processing-associated H-X9-DG protein
LTTDDGLKGYKDTLGPLRRPVLESGPVVSSNVAFLGCAAPGDIDEAIMVEKIAIGPGINDPWVNAAGNGSDITFIEQGELLCEAFNDGPAFWDAASTAVLLLGEVLGGPAPLNRQIEAETNSSSWAPPTGDTPGNGLYLQDTRDWYAVHAGGKNSSVNVLMADGSVKEFIDLNGDKFLNPGFPVDPTLTEDDYARIGYRDGTVELPAAQMFNGVFLINLDKHSKFEADISP